jgi:hypothetical protein
MFGPGGVKTSSLLRFAKHVRTSGLWFLLLIGKFQEMALRVFFLWLRDEDVIA